jgi:hypothetical protein
MSIFTPLPNDTYSLPRAQVLFRRHGTEKWINLGDVEAFSYTPELTEIERYGKDSDTRVLRRSDVIQKDANGSMTLVQMSDVVRGMMFMSDPDSYAAQAEVTAGTYTITNVEPGGIYRLPAFDVTVTAITDGNETEPVNYVEGTHYKVDRRTGFIEILAIPEGASGTDAEVTYDAPEVTATEKRQELGLMQNNGVRGSLFVRGQGAVGPNDEVELWDCEIRPSGDVQLQGEDDYQQIELSFRVYADGTKPAGFEYGRIRSIPKTPLA